MKYIYFLAGMALACTVLTPASAADSNNGNNTSTAAERQWLSIAQVATRLEAAGYRQIEKIEREHGGYEVRATNQAGERLKLRVNPQTGEIMNTQGKTGHGSVSEDSGRASSANCSERRCRDDLPAKAVKPAAPASAAK